MSDTTLQRPIPPQPTAAPARSIQINQDAELTKATRLREYGEHTLRLVQEVEMVLADYLDGRLIRTDDADATPDVTGLSLKEATHAVHSLMEQFSPTHAIRALGDDKRLRLQEQIALEVAYAELCYILRLLVKSIQRTIVVLTSKGGAGKTPLITNLAVLHSFVTTTSNLFLEGNENDGTANMRLGLNRAEQILLNLALSDHTLIKDRNTSERNLGKHAQTSLYVLLSDANEANNMFTMELFLYMYEVLRTQFGSIFGDTGNGNESAANEALFLECDVALLSAVADDPATFAPLLTTLTNLYKLGHKEKVQQQTRIVISGTKPGDTIDNYIERFRMEAARLVQPKFSFNGGKTKPEYWTEDPDQLLRDIGFDYNETEQRFTGKKIFLVPYSQWIREGKPASVLPEETGLETLVAYLEILVDCFRSDVQTTERKAAEIERRLKERSEISPLSSLSKETQANIILQRISQVLQNTNQAPGLDAEEVKAIALQQAIEVLTAQGLLA